MKRFIASTLLTCWLLAHAASLWASSAIGITSPVAGTVSATVTVKIATYTTLQNDWWNQLVVDGTATSINDGGHYDTIYWNSTTVKDGGHTLCVIAHQETTGTNEGEACVPVTVMNIAQPPPPPPNNVWPLTDAAAAAKVVLSTWEPRPLNNTANHTVPTVADLTQVGSISFLNADGNRMVHAVTGNYQGTTDEILQWAAAKWGFPADMARANAVVESYWNQANVGDIGAGVSLSILQVKSSSFPGTCPNGWTATSATSPVLSLPDCYTHLMTAFGADYKYMYQRACVAGDITYLATDTRELAGYPKYVNGPGASNSVLGCIGNWYSGSWYDQGSVNYQTTYTNAFNARAWTQPGF